MYNETMCVIIVNHYFLNVLLFPELFERQELVLENEGASDLLMGRALRDQLARRLASLPS